MAKVPIYNKEKGYISDNDLDVCKDKGSLVNRLSRWGVKK